MNKENETKTCEILDELLELSGHEFTDEEMDRIAEAFAELVRLLRI